MPHKGFSFFFGEFFGDCSYKNWGGRKWVLDAMLGAGFKSTPPGDWVKSLCWKQTSNLFITIWSLFLPATGLSRFVGNKLWIKTSTRESLLLPATGLSRFVGNEAGDLEQTPESSLPATGLSRFVGNSSINLIFPFLNSTPGDWVKSLCWKPFGHWCICGHIVNSRRLG